MDISDAMAAIRRGNLGVLVTVSGEYDFLKPRLKHNGVCQGSPAVAHIEQANTTKGRSRN